MSLKPFGFSKKQRLLNAQDYQTVFNKVDVKAPCEQCLILARSNSLDHPRLGFIFSKKNIRHAVQRNRIKRITRDYYRLNESCLPKMDIIIMARKGIDQLSNDEVRSMLKKQFHKLSKRASKLSTINN